MRRIAALLVGFLLVLEPDSCLYSHYGMNDVPLLATLLLAWLSSGRLAEGEHPVTLGLVTGLLLGVGFGIKYQALLGAVFPLCAGLSLVLRRQWKPALVAAGCVAAGAVAGALLISPLLRSDPAYFIGHFREFMHWQTNISGENVSMADKFYRNLGPFAAVAGTSARWLLLPGIVWALVVLLRPGKRSPQAVVLSTSALAFCVLLSLAVLTSRDLIRDNDLMPVHTFVILLFGLMMTDLARHARETGRLRWAWPVAGALAVLPLLAFFVTSACDSAALARPDTRIRAQEWCHANIPGGSTVLRERYTLPVRKEGVRDYDFRYLASRKARQIIEIAGYDYLITSSLAHDRFYEPHSPYYNVETQSLYREMRVTCTPEAIFEDRRLPFAHPTVTIYRKVIP